MSVAVTGIVLSTGVAPIIVALDTINKSQRTSSIKYVKGVNTVKIKKKIGCETFHMISNSSSLSPTAIFPVKKVF